MVDILDTFVQTDLIKNGKAVNIIMIIRGRLAEILIRITREIYGKFSTKDKYENTTIYVKRLKSLYGLMEASLLFYQNLLKDFEAKDFKTNPYDPCVTNKEINEQVKNAQKNK